jgi:midasin
LGDREDLERIVGEKLSDGLGELGGMMLDFFEWFGVRIGDASGLGLRDILVS